MIRKIQKRANKKGVSEMIGYVLLIAGIMVMSAIVYVWLKSYVPRETPECPDGVSLFVQNSTCINGSAGYNLKLEVKNNGRFSIDGYYIRAATVEGQLAVKDISKYIIPARSTETGMILIPGSLGTGKISSTEYLIDTNIFSIEIVPVMFETINGKNRQIVCGNAKVKENIKCEKEFVNFQLDEEGGVLTFDWGEGDLA